MFELSYFTYWLIMMLRQSWVIMMQATPKSMLTKAFNKSYKSHLLYIYMYIYIYYIYLFIYLLIYLFIHDCHKGPLAPGLLAAILSVSSWKSPASPISKWYSSVRQGFMNDPLFASILVLLCSIFLSYGHFHLGRFNKYIFSTSFRSKENSKI